MNWPTRLFSLRTSTALLLTSALFSLGSCEDTNELGIGLPGTTPITTDYEDFAVIAPIQAGTVLQDSLATTQKDHYIVGRLQDGSTRGLVEARAFLEVTPEVRDSVPAQFVTPTQTPVLDSVTLYAGFDRVYGSATAPVRLSVYDLSRPLDDFAPYNSTSEIAPGPAIATDVPVSLNRVIRNKANTLDSLVGLPLRLPLSKNPAQPTAFATQLFNKLKTTTAFPLSDEELRTVWKGMLITPASTGTAIAFNRSEESKVYVYYHVPVTVGSQVVKKKKVFRILFNDPNQSPAAPRYFTNITYDLRNAGTPFSALQGNGAAQVPAASSGGVVYAQNGTGLETRLVIPGLDTLRARQAKRNIVINRAELIVPLTPYSTAQFAAPSRLYLYEASPTNRVLIYRSGLTDIPRAVQAGSNIVPALPSTTNPTPELALTLTEVNATNKYYTGLLTSYVQAYAKNQLSGPAPTPATFLLTPVLRRAGGSLNLDRAAIDAQNIRLRVYYSNATAR